MDLAAVVVIILIVAVGLIALTAVVGVILLSLRSGRVRFEELPSRTTARPRTTGSSAEDEPTHVRLDIASSEQKES